MRDAVVAEDAGPDVLLPDPPPADGDRWHAGGERLCGERRSVHQHGLVLGRRAERRRRRAAADVGVMISLASIIDGTASTMLAGEKRLDMTGCLGTLPM